LNITSLVFDETQIHLRNGHRAIVMFSGGMDSTVALWWAMNHYDEVKAITVDYNQQHKQEISCAKKICDLIGIDHDVITIGFPSDYWGIENFLTRGQAVLMVSIAALDIGRDGSDIVLGTLRSDPYKDSDRDFLDVLANVMKDQKHDKGEIGIVTPLHSLKDKTAVAMWGYQLGAPISLSWTCRRPEDGQQCLKCPHCEERMIVSLNIYNEYGLREEDILSWQEILGSPFHPAFENANHELQVLARAFVEADGIKSGVPGWRYQALDGKERFASCIHNPPQLLMDKNIGHIASHLRVNGFFMDGSMWEVCVCIDGSVASTQNLPNIDVIEKELINRVEF